MTIEKPEKKYKLGLSLSGGGARGFAHPGAIKAIEEAGMKPDVIAGTSAGAFAGVLYADGYSPEEIIELFLGKNLLQFAEIKVPTIAIFGTAGFRRFLKKHLRAKNFENLQIPMKVIATNLEEGLTTVFEQGPIIDALVASCSIPVVFPPVKIGNASYMDGGIFKNFPVSIIRSECEKIIGVNVSPLVSKKSSQSIMHIAERTFHYMSRNNTLLDRNLCDILIEMKDLVDYNILDLKSAAKIFKLGYENAQKSLNNSPLISPFE